MRALDAAGGGLEDLAARRNVARERHHANGRVGDQRRTDALATADDEVEDPFRQEVGRDFGEFHCREGRLFGGLQHDRVAGRDGRRHLPGQHHERVVPGRYRAHHTHGIAADHARVAGQIFARNRALHAAHRTGEESEAIDGSGDLVLHDAPERLATVEALETGKLVRIGLDRIGDLEERRRPLARRRPRPFRESPLRGLDRRVHLHWAGLEDRADHGARRGIDEGFA